MRAAARKYFLGQPLAVLLGGASAAVPPVEGYNAWFDGADAATITVASGRMSQWNDKSGNDYHLTQLTEVDKPFYGSRTLNGIIVPDFQNDQYMLSDMPRSNRPNTTFVVIELDNVSGTKTWVSPNGTGANHFRASSDNIQTTTSSSVLKTTSGVLAASTPVVLVQNLTTTTMEHRVNDDVVDGPSAQSTVFTSGRTTYVGTNGSNPTIEEMDGVIAEVINYPASLTDAEMDLVVAHLMNKWGIS